MKKLTFTIYIIAVAIITQAQTINFGLKAGLNMGLQDHGGYTFGNGYLAGFNAGGIMDISFQHFSIQPGLMFSVKGESDSYKFNNINPFNGGNYLHSDTYLDYIEVPVYFLYKATPINGTSLHFGGGPYIAAGISETDIVDGTTYSSHKFNYQNPDVGLGLIVGVTIRNRLQVDAGYEYGFVNIDNNGYATRNTVISLSAGYLFK
jgi:hypothetical protein